MLSFDLLLTFGWFVIGFQVMIMLVFTLERLGESQTAAANNKPPPRPPSPSPSYAAASLAAKT